MTDRRELLAGSIGPERIPARPDPDDAEWYLPLHVRDQRAARDRLAAQVAVGVDVVVAPTWLTHRRALLPLGETRRAAAWTAAAVRVARDAVELGLERREELLAETAADDVRRGRPMPLVAASLPALDEDPEPGTGRLLPREAATERDYRAQASLLAEAQPDLLLVEGQRAETDARSAISEAAETGLPTWASLSDEALSTTDLEGWLDWGRGAGVERLLLPLPVDARQAAADGGLPWGALARSADPVTDWLEAGAGVVACLDGASVTALEPIRAAIDDYERAAIEVAHAAERRWLDHVALAASMAPGGAAAWLGPVPAAPLPDGFEWLVVDAIEARHLPADRYRLVIATAEPGTDPGRLLERGGVLASQGAGTRRSDADLRVHTLDDTAVPPLVIYRREG